MRFFFLVSLTLTGIKTHKCYTSLFLRGSSQSECVKHEERAVRKPPVAPPRRPGRRPGSTLPSWEVSQQLNIPTELVTRPAAFPGEGTWSGAAQAVRKGGGPQLAQRCAFWFWRHKDRHGGQDALMGRLARPTKLWAEVVRLADAFCEEIRGRVGV